MLAVLFATYDKRDPNYDDGLSLRMDMFLRKSPKGMCVKCLGIENVYSIDEDKIFSDGITQLKVLLVERFLYRGGVRKRLDEFCDCHGDCNSTDPYIG